MVNFSPDAADLESTQSPRIIIVHENSTAREYAMRSDLVGAEDGAGGRVLESWSFEQLSGSTSVASDAAMKAATADLIIFAISPAGELSLEIKLWIENWIVKRSDREGAIVGLVARQASPGELACLKEIYLRHTALRAGMDYLSHVPSALAKAMPDSLESYRQRAGQVTSVLDEILCAGSPPPPARL